MAISAAYNKYRKMTQIETYESPLPPSIFKIKGSSKGGPKSVRSNMNSPAIAASENIKNNRIFTYKIIHDLRHPTQAVADGIEWLISYQKP